MYTIAVDSLPFFCVRVTILFLKSSLIYVFLLDNVLLSLACECHLFIFWEYHVLYSFNYQHISIHLGRSTQIPGAKTPWWLNLLWLYLMFVGPQYGTCFSSHFWCLEFWGSCSILGRFVHPCIGYPFMFKNTRIYHIIKFPFFIV